MLRLMHMIGLTCVAPVALAGRATAESVAPDVDHAIVFELGAEADWSHAEGLHTGGTFAFEVTPIEH